MSIKQLQENPWNKIQKTYTVGEKRKGIIKEVLDFGLVVEISETKDEGFMHISDITYRKYFKLDKSFKVGDEIEFVILELNNEKQRISLSSRLILDEKWNNIEEHIKLGEKYKGKVIFAQNYGMFVEIETGIEAFIRKSDYSWTKETAKDYVEDDIVEFLITNIDLENKKIAASIKDLYESPC